MRYEMGLIYTTLERKIWLETVLKTSLSHETGIPVAFQDAIVAKKLVLFWKAPYWKFDVQDITYLGSAIQRCVINFWTMPSAVSAEYAAKKEEDNYPRWIV